jgi:hypothetical protein
VKKNKKITKDEKKYKQKGQTHERQVCYVPDKQMNNRCQKQMLCIAYATTKSLKLISSACRIAE